MEAKHSFPKNAVPGIALLRSLKFRCAPQLSTPQVRVGAATIDEDPPLLEIVG